MPALIIFGPRVSSRMMVLWYHTTTPTVSPSRSPIAKSNYHTSVHPYIWQSQWTFQQKSIITTNNSTIPYPVQAQLEPLQHLNWKSQYHSPIPIILLTIFEVYELHPMYTVLQKRLLCILLLKTNVPYTKKPKNCTVVVSGARPSPRAFIIQWTTWNSEVYIYYALPIVLLPIHMVR